ncbi:MAG: hypothetical protein ORN98_10335, partial [Alphaproteobacteria bacterium]|nr:hypothetical protein [Alphaproteobacteria bacterium]
MASVNFNQGQSSRLTARDQARDLSAYAAALRQRIEAEVTGFSPNPRDRAKRIERAEHDFDYYCQTYFPHYIRHTEKSELHIYLHGRIPEIIANPQSCLDALAAPRGEAKSTLVSQLLPLWMICRATKH